MLRFSLSALFVAVFVVALFYAALTYASVPWLDLVRTLTWFVLLSSLVAAVVSKGRSRAIAAGMALFGWGVVYLHSAVPSHTSIVESVIDWAHFVVHGPPPEPQADADSSPPKTISDFFRQPQPTMVMCGMDAPTTPEQDLYDGRYLRFFRIVDLGLIMASSLLGGFVGLFFHFRSCLAAS